MADYSKISDDKLLKLLYSEGDTLPRQVIDEICRREGMVQRLAAIVADPYNWNEPLPAWWAPVHAVYALGALGTAETVLPLLKALRYAEACENEWVAEDLGAIFGVVGPVAEEGLRTMAADRTSGWLVRAIALEGLAAMTLRSPEREEGVFRLISAVFLDNSEDRQLRRNAGGILLDFLRPENKEELIAFGGEERELMGRDPLYKAAFSDCEVEAEFRQGNRMLEHYRKDWLRFYDPEEIGNRQQRWDKERIETASKPEHTPAHELCPFASGTHQKKCCLGKVGIA